MQRILSVKAVTFAVATPKGDVDVTFTRKKIVIAHGGAHKTMKRESSDNTIPNQTRARKVVENFLRGGRLAGA